MIHPNIDDADAYHSDQDGEIIDLSVRRGVPSDNEEIQQVADSQSAFQAIHDDASSSDDDDAQNVQTEVSDSSDQCEFQHPPG